jgi:Second Messenger Oligonucleotide or Dinucleotide Synthetase domain
MVIEVTARDEIATAALDALLRRTLSEIEPTPAQKEGAQRSHNHLRNLLDTGQMGSRILSSYLSGSYARDTAIRPLDDVDIIFEIEPTAWKAGFIFNPLPPPERVLDSIAAAVRRRYQLSSVYGQRRSVCLRLNHLDIDVVPAISDASDPTLILVPDRKSGDWLKSSPLRHAENATRVNTKRRGKFKPLVKLLKFWNSNLPTTSRCKSFMIETIAVRIFSETAFNTFPDGLLLFWDFIASRYGDATIARWPNSFGMSFGWFSVSVPDAGGTGSNTAAYFDAAHARALAVKARISRDKLLAAYNARNDDTRQASLLDALRW